MSFSEDLLKLSTAPLRFGRVPLKSSRAPLSLTAGSFQLIECRLGSSATSLERSASALGLSVRYWARWITRTEHAGKSPT